MGPAEAIFDNSAYSPGDAWTHPQFATMAPVPPKIIDQISSGENTTPSYFENRVFRNGALPTVTVAVSAGTVVLEGSIDGGTTWITVKTYSAATTDVVDYPTPLMLRLRATAGSNIDVSLSQSL